MKRHFLLLLLLLALLLPQTSDAQRKRKVVKQPEPVEDPRIGQMLSATQQIVFIDSMVVRRSGFVDHIPLSADCGLLFDDDGLGCHTSELGDHRLLAVRDDSVSHVCVSDLIGGEWTTPVRAEGLGDAAANFPYLMPDGTTLYFAQQGNQSLGGYDLFVTRYNSADAAFYRAENLGMPFASADGDDLLYAIDETYGLGYFVTDRRQPTGYVCIYVFIPPTTRRTYSPDAYSEQQLRSLARIDRIADTWSLVGDDVRQGALQRLAEARQTSQRPTTNGQHPAANSHDGDELSALRAQAADLERALDQMRRYYARATADERRLLRDEILSGERELEQLQATIKHQAKQQRNALYE